MLSVSRKLVLILELRCHLFWKHSQIHSNQLRFFPCCVPTAPSMSFYYNPSHVILKLCLPLSLIKASERSLPAARSPLTVSSSHTEPQLVQLQGASFPHGPQGCATRWPRAQNVLGPRRWCQCAILYSFSQATPQPTLQVHGELILLFPFSLPFCHSHCTQTNPTSSLSWTAFMPCTQAEQT